MKDNILAGAVVEQLGCSEIETASFRELIYDYYGRHGRSLAWRETFDPYAILISEIMLQQTPVDRVREKYRAFLAAFPGFAELARVELSQVLSVWQGLGYNRRAVSLRLCAQAVVERFAGLLPETVEDLESLPGIGIYTSRAIATFAFGEPTPFIETNIRSVFIHHFFRGRDAVKDSEILPLVDRTLDRKQPRDWYYALMDYGAMLKKTQVNPSRLSAHYARQSTCRGSNREQRSLILRGILAAPGVTEAELVNALAGEAASVSRNLLQLEGEGFIRQECGRFSIR
jgi:A/G-specific adenine glycosylase